MPQSLVKNYVHIVVSTKNRQPFIDKSIETELHAYLGGICKELDCPLISIGGVEDHVHILCLLSQKIALSELSQPDLVMICLRLSRFKKENKELLTYLLFEANDEEGYIESVKGEIDFALEEINRRNFYFIKKGK